ncbi:methyl-accepting chemotaxis protein [Bosea sp. (in: a-proteobacteria)]|uniref:HAMP domain-containing methyl-accepting chemotaxis protein n=1 Tax=Bosea sp. (in: a-proteobacteria) TaxID=1871050 RepID=UPI002735C33A|nr:methyl-accepting chemotaxis protein [Bosea sp. (in: a-proteobacteria)]MDP3411329.1 methyl-accepting chemotaxis protein [Bosea sp. (in: a-proteobacteria)]
MLKNITIRQSLIGIVIALAVALFGTITMSMLAMRDIKDDTRVLSQEVMPTVQISNDVQAEMLSRHLRLNMHVNSTDAESMTQLENNIREYTNSLATKRRDLVTKLALQQSRDALARYESQVPAYVAGLDKVLDLSRKGDKQAATVQLREMRPTLAAMEKAIDDLSAHVASRGVIVTAEAEKAYSFSVWIMIGIAIVSAIVSLGAVLIVTKRVTGPIQDTTKTMNELAQGHLETTIHHADRNDEVGLMAKALQVFRESLVKVRALEEQERAASERRLRAAESMALVVTDVGEVVAAAANGDFSARLQIDQADDQMQKLVAGINEINAVVDMATTEFASALSAVAGGDLTVRVDSAYRGKFAELKSAINETVDRLSSTVKTIQLTSADVGLAAREINTGADDLSKRTEGQASSLEETAATTEELAASVKASAQASRNAAMIANEAMQAAQNGGAIAGQAVEAMARIESASQKISDIIRVIDDIAFQTNLLALNAAVEAARAGDAGKGFAVVASEVRTLAQRSSEAAKDISALISSSNTEVGEGVKLVRLAGDQLSQILTSSQKVAATIADISAASGEQANGIDEMSQAVAHLDEMTQQNAALSEQSAASAASLSSRIAQLNDLVAAFKTGPDGGHAGSHAAPRGAASEPARLRQLAQAAFAHKAPAPRAAAPAPRAATAAPAKKVANSRAGDSGWEEF